MKHKSIPFMILPAALSFILSSCGNLSSIFATVTPTPTPTLTPTPTPIPVFEGMVPAIINEGGILFADLDGGYMVTLPTGWVSDLDYQPQEPFLPRLSASLQSEESSDILAYMTIATTDDPSLMKLPIGEINRYIVNLLPKDEIILTEVRQTSNGIFIGITDTTEKKEPYLYTRTVIFKSKTRIGLIFFETLKEDTAVWAVSDFDKIVESIQLSVSL